MTPMEAGKALDRLIAEKVYGLPLQAHSIEAQELLPEYSCNLNLAFMAAEKVNLFKGPYVTLTYEDGEWGVTQHDFQYSDQTDLGRAKTIPHAICLAILERMRLRENPVLPDNIVHRCGTKAIQCKICKEGFCPTCYPGHQAECLGKTLGEGGI